MNEEKRYYIYKHTTPNGKVYIGQTCKKPEQRWANGYGYKHQMFYNAIQKYGWDNISHEILFEGLTKEEADQKEIELITFYDSTNPDNGYNIAFGGAATLGVKCSEERKRKISEAHKGKKRSEESKKKQSKTMMGHDCSEETKKKIGEANSKRVWSEESKRKLSEHFKGRPISEEHKEKIRNYFKLHAPNKRAVICVETQIVYESLSDAGRKTGINRRSIGSVCSGDRPTAGGYHWCFLNNYDKNTYILQKPKTTNIPKSVICVETGAIYKSVSETSRDIGVSSASISKVCNGKQKTAGGYHWMYYEDYLKENLEDNYGEAI